MIRRIILLILINLSIILLLRCNQSETQNKSREGIKDASAYFQNEYKRFKDAAGGVNKVAHLPYLTENNQQAQMMSVDAFYSAIPYKITDHPVGLSVPVPTVSPSSLTVFDSDASEVFSIDNRDMNGTKYKLIIAREEQQFDQSDAKVLYPGSDSGIVMVRYVIPKDEVLNTMDTVRHKMISGPIEQMP